MTSEMNSLSSGTKNLILREVFAAECQVVGSENLDDMCESDVEFARNEEEGGVHLSVSESIAILANAVTIIMFVWQVMLSRRSAPPSPTLEEIDAQGNCSPPAVALSVR